MSSDVFIGIDDPRECVSDLGNGGSNVGGKGIGNGGFRECAKAIYLPSGRYM